MESEMFGIGEMARGSGLSVSALRFYDDAGVLTPALVDPRTGYRRYARGQLRAARLVAALRRVGMPLAGITRVLACQGDPSVARPLLDDHLRRLEDGLAAARRELSRVHALLDNAEQPMSVNPTRATVTGPDLARAIDAVRYAVGHDPDLPALTGVLIEVEHDLLRLVASDRHRLAVAEVTALDVCGPPVNVLAPLAFVDEVRALRDESGLVLTVDAGTVTARAGDLTAGGRALDHDFPDYRVVLPRRGTHRVTVDVAALRRDLAAAPAIVRPDEHVSVLTLDSEGRLTAMPGEQPGVRIGVNREFLLQALAAPGRRQLVLEFGGPITPLAVRVPGDEGLFSLLMPVRL